MIAYRGYTYWKLKLRMIMEQENKSLLKKLESADEKFSEVAQVYVGIVCKIILLVGITFCAFALAALLTMIAISTCSAISSQLF